MIPAWAIAYVGLEFQNKGRERPALDCWGLSRLIWREQFGLDVPSYVDRYTSTVEREEIAQLLTGGLKEDWIRIEDQPRAGDGVVMRLRGQPWHVGVMVDDENFLHVTEDLGESTIERRSDTLWRNRVYGIFRHRSLACS